LGVHWHRQCDSRCIFACRGVCSTQKIYKFNCKYSSKKCSIALCVRHYDIRLTKLARHGNLFYVIG